MAATASGGGGLIGLLWGARAGQVSLRSLANVVVKLGNDLPRLKFLTEAAPDDILEEPLQARKQAVSVWNDFIHGEAMEDERQAAPMMTQRHIGCMATACLAARMLTEHIWLLSNSTLFGDCSDIADSQGTAKRIRQQAAQDLPPDAIASLDDLVRDPAENPLQPAPRPDLCHDALGDMLRTQGHKVDEENMLRQPDALLVQDIGNLRNLLDVVIMDVSSLAVEKHGVAPHVHIDDSLRSLPSPLVSIPMYLDTLLRELLKNAFTATISRHGIDADMAPPIEIRLSRFNHQLAKIAVVDSGSGVPLRIERSIFDWFFTSQAANKNPSYTFSGDFGGVLAGEGVGLPLSRTYAQLLGGDLALSHVYRPSGAVFHLLLPTLTSAD
ncbi:hypothetical protein PTSG_00063 [Salpingoeca rosetta]|uniref:Protein-serine/threonine kinase n=1 Tax=Salpingoeca rosetta (strain ATCC 50818 / BSB-021) TaxID=946362 RepID=F2TVF1_SALR5|nr:uncharacterized protein PTSG_00063 [Salpingoeca rosetta]EGD72047.1 hypothetical protein PTSG_00063 [Salpingoeca rosetta]|eukprot:XP_004998619.1 hypothetical protein PTSG_00063 [Salpingoeca rosetta]